MLDRNVADLVKPPSTDTPPPRALADGDTEAFLRAMEGERTVVVPAPALEKVRAWQIRQEAERPAHGASWRDQGSVVTRWRGGKYTGKDVEPRAINDYPDKILKKATRPHVTVHDLRHTFYTWLLSQRVANKMGQLLDSAKICPKGTPSDLPHQKVP